MPNVFHKDYTLDNCHALHAREYADVTARDADAAFNTDSANVGKAVLVDTPATIYTLLTTAPLFLELSATGPGSGNVTTSDTLTANQMITGNGVADIQTEPNLIFDGSALGINVTPASVTLDVNPGTGQTMRLRGGDLATGNGNQILFSADGGVNFTHVLETRHDTTECDLSSLRFLLHDPSQQAPGDLGFNPALTLRADFHVGINTENPGAALDIEGADGDTTPVVIFKSGANAATTRFRTGDRDPRGNVTGTGPDVYYSDQGSSLSGTFESRSAGNDTEWFRRSVLPSNIVEVHDAEDIETFAVVGTITITENTTWRLRASISTNDRIVINSPFALTITGEGNAGVGITYTGTSNFISGTGSLITSSGVSLTSTSTGTLFSLTFTSPTSIVSLSETRLIGWDNVGSISGYNGFLMSGVVLINVDSGFTLNNNLVLNFENVLQTGTELTGDLFTINTRNPASTHTFTDVDARTLSSTGAVFDLDTRISNQTNTNVSRATVSIGDLFRQTTLTNATINSISDGSPSTGTITEMDNNGSGLTTISCTTTYFENEEVTISGTTSYDGVFQIFNNVPGVEFDIFRTFVADDATGSVDSTRLTLALAGGHGISTGDSLKIIDTNFYNAFKETLNVVSDDVTVNGVFVSTNAGSIERDVGLDQTDPRVFGFLNNGFPASAFIATAFVNDNSTANPAIVNNTFRDMLFGTVGDALVAGSSMERWKLVSELLGTFEYIGDETFDGNITFDFTVASSGGTTDFRFRWQIDTGSGFGDLDDPVEVLVAVGSDAESITKTFPLRVNKGDQITPEITRNSGASTITTTYATIYAGMG